MASSRFVRITDADGFARLAAEPAGDKTLLVLDITKADINSCNVASVLERLFVLTDTKNAVYRFRECLIFQVAGYDTDRRELPEIESVRLFFQRLVAEWPHWPWFLARGLGALGLLMSLLCDVRIVRGRPGTGFGTEFEDGQQFIHTFHDLVLRQEAMLDAFDVDDVMREASFASAADEIFGKLA